MKNEVIDIKVFLIEKLKQEHTFSCLLHFEVVYAYNRRSKLPSPHSFCPSLGLLFNVCNVKTFPKIKIAPS